MRKPNHTETEVEALFRAHGGQLRLSEALSLGANRYQFYKLRDAGIIEAVSRGVYRLTDLPATANPDIAVVAARYPNAVLCLVSALSWHGLTTQIPRHVDLAVERNARLPRLNYPPVKSYRFRGKRFSSGIELQEVDGFKLRVYDPEKTLADCFAYRNKLGMDLVLEALKLYAQTRKRNYAAVIKYARICRVEKAMRPYLEANL